MIPLRESNLVHLIEKLLLLRASQIYDSVKSQTFFSFNSESLHD